MPGLVPCEGCRKSGVFVLPGTVCQDCRRSVSEQKRLRYELNAAQRADSLARRQQRDQRYGWRRAEHGGRS